MANYLKVVFIPYRKMSPIIDKKKKIAHCLPFDRITKYHPFRVPSTTKDGWEHIFRIRLSVATRCAQASVFSPLKRKLLRSRGMNGWMSSSTSRFTIVLFPYLLRLLGLADGGPVHASVQEKLWRSITKHITATATPRLRNMITLRSNAYGKLRQHWPTTAYCSTL